MAMGSHPDQNISTSCLTCRSAIWLAFWMTTTSGKSSVKQCTHSCISVVFYRFLLFFLGGVALQYDVTTLNEFGRTKSPTFAMFADWGQKNHTITELFIALSKMQQYRAMTILKPYGNDTFE